jgi:hypothetical protein
MLELSVATYDCCILRPNNALHALHELAKDLESSLRWQDKWSWPVFGMGSNGMAISHWADALNGDGVVLLHGNKGRISDSSVESLRVANKDHLGDEAFAGYI